MKTSASSVDWAETREEYDMTQTRSTLATSGDVKESMALIEKGQQLAGHHPSAEALERAHRVLTSQTTVEQARAEVDAKYGRVR